eukprot:13134055-Ditylum_brightwellii.AAC.1
MAGVEELLTCTCMMEKRDECVKSEVAVGHPGVGVEDGVLADGALSGLWCGWLGEVGRMFSEVCGVSLGRACLGYLALGLGDVYGLDWCWFSVWRILVG